MHDRTKQFLRDALEEAFALQHDLANTDLKSYARSRQLQRISERSLEIIGESLRRATSNDPGLLDDDIHIRDWINLRNVISHQYDSLQIELIWEASTVELSLLIEKLERLTS